MSAKVCTGYLVGTIEYTGDEDERKERAFVFTEEEAKDVIRNLIKDEHYFDPFKYDRVFCCSTSNHDEKCIDFRKNCCTHYRFYYRPIEFIRLDQ